MTKIMIVEDSATQMEALKRIVEGLGYQAICLTTADHALDQAIDQEPDLILMDLVLPGTSGFQATRMISTNGKTSEIPIVVVSTKTEKTDEIWARRQGAKEYITKPFLEKDLVSAIKKYVK